MSPPVAFASPARTPSNAALLTDLSVMIIDPLEASRAVLRDSVSPLGILEISCLRGDSDATRMVRAAGTSVDFIFCEYHLTGDRDGQQLLEELRSEQMISPQTSCLMVTSESSGKKAAATSEFVPDGHVIKPFSVGQLGARLTRSVTKRKMLAPVFSLINRSRFQEAVAESLRIAAALPAFQSDCTRMAVDLMLSHGREVSARGMLESLVASSGAPWAALQIARLKLKDGRLDEAAEMLEQLLGAHPEDLRANDSLVDVRLRQGSREAASATPKKACARSNANASSMRRLGNLAEDFGDLETAERVFGQVLERTRDSGMLSGEESSNLSRLFVAHGKRDKLEKLASDQKKMLKGHEDFELSTALLELHQLHHGTGTRRDAEVRRLIVIEAEDIAGEFSTRLVVEVICAGLGWGHQDEGFRIATQMAKRRKPDTVVLNEMQEILDRHRSMQRQSRVVGIDELLCLVLGPGEGKLDKATCRTIERSLMAARCRDPSDKRVKETEQRWIMSKELEPLACAFL